MRAPTYLRAAEPQQHHHEFLTRVAQIVALICAGVAGFSIGVGWLAPDDGGIEGYGLPVVLGVGIGAAWSIVWHLLMTAGARVRTPVGRVGVGVVSAIVMGTAIYASTWPMATALSGKPAMRQYRNGQTATVQAVLLQAGINIKREAALIPVMRSAAETHRGNADIEARGGISGRPGRAALTASLTAVADRADQLVNTMQKALADAERNRKLGETLRIELQRATDDDNAKAFNLAAVKVQDVIASLDAFRLTDIAQTPIGLAAVINDPAAANIKESIERVTRQVASKSGEIEAQREQLAVPDLQPIEPREAVRRYAGGAALGGWAAAVAIDVLPGLLLALVMVTGEEPLMLRSRRERPRRPPIYYGDDDDDDDPPEPPMLRIPPPRPRLPYHGSNGATPPSTDPPAAT